MAQLGCRVLPKPDDPVKVPHIMRALDPGVFDAVWTAVKDLLPAAPETLWVPITRSTRLRGPSGIRRMRQSTRPGFWRVASVLQCRT